MKRWIAFALAVIICAITSVGATWAYMVNGSEDPNVMTVGKIKIEQLEFEREDPETQGEGIRIQRFHANKSLYPGVYQDTFDFGTTSGRIHWDAVGKEGYSTGIWDPEQVSNELDKMVFVRNEGNRDAYIRTVFAFETLPEWSLEKFRDSVHLNKNGTTWAWTWVETPVLIGEGVYYVAVATYNQPLPGGGISDISLSQVILDKRIAEEDFASLGDTYHILVYTQAIQSDGFTDPDTALNEGFGTVDSVQMPFVDDAPIQGGPMHDAIRYLDADGETDISARVTGVVFGTFDDYPQIPLRYDSTVIAAEDGQEVCVYYDMDENEQFTIYVLSDDVIYLPADSTGLFANMSALTTVETSNLDVSRVEVMDKMFYKCEKLRSVDVSTWDTSNVRSTNDMFYCCIQVNNLDVSNWDVSNVTSMSGMFDMFGTSQRNTALTYLHVSNWDVSNVTNMSRLFLGCNKLDNLDLSNWDTSSVTNLYRALGNLYSLTTWEIENWDVSNCTTLEDTFVNCEKITKLDLSKWDVSKVTNMQGTFTSLISCTELNLSGWDTSNVTNMLQTFWNCKSMNNVIGLSEFNTSKVTTFRGMFGYCSGTNQDWHVDLSKWDTSSATNMYMMFYIASGVTMEGLENWDTSNLTNTYAMFHQHTKVKELDLSGWNTSKLTNASYMFDYCSSLETIYVSDQWTNAGITSSSNMFRGCSKLVGGAGTKVSTTNATYARIDTPETPGYLTHIDDKPVA